MLPAGEGVILNVSSMTALRPLTRAIAYGSAKAAVTNFTQWLAVHLAQNFSPRIRVNAIAPGFFITDLNRHLLTDLATGELSARGQAIVTHTPQGRFGAPEDLTGRGSVADVAGRCLRHRHRAAGGRRLSGLQRGLTMDTIGAGRTTGVLTEAEVEAQISAGLARLPLAGQRVLLIVPDGTRTMPLPLFFRMLMAHLRPQTRAVDVLIALGTHPPMSRAALLQHVGVSRRNAHPSNILASN